MSHSSGPLHNQSAGASLSILLVMSGMAWQMPPTFCKDGAQDFFKIDEMGE